MSPIAPIAQSTELFRQPLCEMLNAKHPLVKLVLILCLLMPLQGFAAMKVAYAPCPMQAMMTMDDGSVDKPGALATAMEDCCNDPATFERTGQACKSTLSCVVPTAGMPSVSALVALVQVTQEPQAPVWRSLPPGASTRLWRPPTSV